MGKQRHYKGNHLRQGAQRAVQIGAEYAGGVHDDAPLLALLGSVPRRSMSGPLCSLQANFTMVKCGATPKTENSSSSYCKKASGQGVADVLFNYHPH
jgi:hypothetical protein